MIGKFHSDMKTCFKCNQELELEHFYKHPAMADGRLGKCKDCAKADSIANRVKNIDRIIAYDRARSKLPHRVAGRTSFQTRNRLEHPEKSKARDKVLRAIKTGILKRMPCEECGAPLVEAHHEDYSKPLDVVWLCQKHHKARHRKYDYDKIAEKFTQEV